MDVKSEEEIRARIALLKERAAAPKVPKTTAAMLVAAEDALSWVLGSDDADETWSWQRDIDEGLAR